MNYALGGMAAELVCSVRNGTYSYYGAKKVLGGATSVLATLKLSTGLLIVVVRVTPWFAAT